MSITSLDFDQCKITSIKMLYMLFTNKMLYIVFKLYLEQEHEEPSIQRLFEFDKIVFLSYSCAMHDLKGVWNHKFKTYLKQNNIMVTMVFFYTSVLFINGTILYILVYRLDRALRLGAYSKTGNFIIARSLVQYTNLNEIAYS